MAVDATCFLFPLKFSTDVAVCVTTCNKAPTDKISPLSSPDKPKKNRFNLHFFFDVLPNLCKHGKERNEYSSMNDTFSVSECDFNNENNGPGEMTSPEDTVGEENVVVTEGKNYATQHGRDN